MARNYQRFSRKISLSSRRKTFKLIQKMCIDCYIPIIPKWNAHTTLRCIPCRVVHRRKYHRARYGRDREAQVIRSRMYRQKNKEKLAATRRIKYWSKA